MINTKGDHIAEYQSRDPLRLGVTNLVDGPDIFSPANKRVLNSKQALSTADPDGRAECQIYGGGLAKAETGVTEARRRKPMD